MLLKSVAAARTRLYVSALVQAGASAKDAAYSINNAASLSSGGVALPGESSASFKPSIPVMAEKSDATTPQGGLETQSASFTVKVGTGEAAREGFTLTDQITTMYDYNDSAAAAQKAMMLSALTVQVTLANGAEESFDAAKIANGEVAGLSLAMADGSELALNVPGSFGNNRGWKLAFGKLPAGATVTVDYTLTVDRAAYVAAGGDLDSVVTFRNAFAVSTADGSTAEDSSTGKVKVQPYVSKKGADGDYLLSCEVVDGGDGAAADSVVFNNETIPEVPDNPGKPGNPDTPDTPGNPDKPDTPEVPDSPDAPQAPEAPGDENVLSETGDGAPTALLLALALGGLGLAAIVRRLRRQ